MSSFYSVDTVNGVGVSIANYTFTEVTKVSGLDFRTLWEILTRSAAWLDDLLPCSILWTGFVLQ